MTDSLDNKSDAELNELFAREVSEWKPTTDGGICWDASGQAIVSVPNYCTDANAVLPWLEKWGWKGTSGAKEGAAVCVIAGPGKTVVGIAPTFCRAAVIGLLRAARATS